MFKRGNFIAKYKQYTRSLKSLQVKLRSQEPLSIVNKYEKISHSIKNVLENSKILSQQSRVLCTIQDSIDEKIAKSKKNYTNASQTWRKNRFFKTSVFSAAAAVPIVKADTISGYNQQDYELLTQLGILSNDTKPPVNSNNALLETNSTNLSSNATGTDINVPDDYLSNSANTSASNIEFPSSLYDYQQSYTSIFDNLPEERNDLYTTFNNLISFTSDQATQVAAHELIPPETITKSNELDTNDLFVIETPGAQAGNAENIGFNEMLIDVAVPSSLTEETVGEGATEMNELLTNNIPNQVGDITEVVASVASQINNTLNSSTAEGNIIIEPIPEPPALPDLAAEAASQINALGEPTFASLGLGGSTPVGFVQNCFEYIHVGLGIPWWEAICIGTLIIRFAMFPLVIIAQRNAAKMNNHLPQMQVIQLKMTEARQSGNQMEVARYSQELMMFMKEKKLNPFKNMVVPLAQMPIFISFFMGLREMANVPIESLRSGGLFWFSDLTVPDQFFALPIITSLTLWATIELGTDSARLSSQNMQTMKYVLRAMPFMILPFTVNFPGAILCYWVSSNFISLAQVGFLKIPAVRDYFKIEPMLHHDMTKLPIKSKGFVGGLKDSWTNIKITKELEERRRLDDIQFQRAGKGPLVKTYKYDPTKQVVKAKSAIKSSS